jgi:3-deoxy-D-manno-octulosonic-acid transferase
MRFLYSCLTYLLAPVYLGVLLWRGLRERGYWRGLDERFGLGAALPHGSAWIHAASVGEVQAAAALVAALKRTIDGALLITTATAAGAERARALLGQDVQVRHAPLDLPGAVRRFFDRAQPRIAIVLETELWPNLYHECVARSVPLVLASARLSARSVRRYRLIAPLTRRTLACADLIAAQSEADAERFRALGAPPARTHVVGNLKFDLSLPSDTRTRGEALRARCAGTRPVWVAGSTHEGEERDVVQAHARLRQAHPEALLILVPRHRQRFEEVAAWLARTGVSFARLSRDESCGHERQVLLGDTVGQLLELYAAADIAFVGGSLVPIGGHNLLEPAALERPILAGPYNGNGAEIASLLVACGAARIVHDAHELGDELGLLLSSPAERARMGASARAVLEANRGALARLLALMEPLARSPLKAAAAPAESAGSRET